MFLFVFLLFTIIAMPCLIISFNYDMSVANEAKWPVPNGVLLPVTNLQLFISNSKEDNAHKTILV